MRSMRGKVAESRNDSECICSCKHHPGVRIWRPGDAQMGTWISAAQLGYDACEVAAASGSVLGTAPPAQMIGPRWNRCRVSCAIHRRRWTAHLLDPPSLPAGGRLPPCSSSLEEVWLSLPEGLAEGEASEVCCSDSSPDGASPRRLGAHASVASARRWPRSRRRRVSRRPVVISRRLAR